MTEDNEREFPELVNECYEVFKEHTEELGFVSKVQIEEASEEDMLYYKHVDGEIVAVALIRHCKRKPQSTLQDIAVLEEHRGKGLAKEIIEDAAEDSPHPKMVAKCPCDLPSNNWYDSQGWELVETQEGKNRDLNVWEKELIETESALDW